MYIESVLLHLGYRENNIYNADSFQMFSKEHSHLFVYESKKDGKRYFSSASGEFTGGPKDLVVFFYNTQNSSIYNETERLQIFNDLHKEELATPKKLKPISSFNLYKILLEETDKETDKSLINSVKNKKNHYFFFIDEEKIKSGLNILGVVALNLETREEKEIQFSELNRSIYFTNPSIKSDEAFIFNSFNEMLSFKKRQTKDIFYIVVKGKFNENHAKTIAMVLKSKGIKSTYLAFPGNIKGYESDLNYLSVFSNIKIKSRTAFYKLNIPITKESDLLIDKVKTLKNIVENDLETHTINKLISIAVSKDHLGNDVFVVELPKISNVIMSFLVLSSKYLFKDKEFKIIKPKGVYWNENNEPIKNASKEFKINVLESIKEIYAYN